MEKEYRLVGLDCANCGNKIEQRVAQIKGIQQANVDFMQKKLTIACDKADVGSVEQEMTAAIKKIEPEVTLQKFDSVKPQQRISFKEQLRQPIVWRIGLTLIGLVIASLLPAGIAATILYVGLYLLIGGDIVKNAVINIFHGQLFDENFLMSLATVGALAIGEFPEAVAVMLLYQIGEFFQDYAVEQSKRSVHALLDIRPDTARLLSEGVEQIVSPEKVKVGDLILVNPGERIPLDGVVVKGEGYVDTSALTGEAMPQLKTVDSNVLSGCINQSGQLTIEVSKPFGQSTVQKILELVENASSQKAPAEKFITKFARYYTPIVVLLAVLLVAVPTLFFAGDFHEWLYRALTFLVISCPCALVISVPLSFFSGIGGASKAGILVKGSNYLETLAKVDTVVFDKTGTLTEGNFAVEKIASPLDQKEFLKYVTSLEQASNHPIAQSILAAYGDRPLFTVDELQEVAGHGIKGVIDGQIILAGNRQLLADISGVPQVTEVGTIVYLAIGKQYAGYLVVADQIKEDAPQAIAELQQAGVKQTVMLTGDNQAVATAVGKKLGLSQVFSQLLPADKVSHLKTLLKQGTVAFVGDGINDAPVIATADVGVAMGALGSDAAIEAADVVIMDDRLEKLALGIKISRKTLRIVKQNIVFALGVKFIVLILGALGLASMGAAVFADVGVTFLAVLNAMRCLRIR